MIPRQRKPGQFGGRGGHGRNMHNAQKRDSRPGGKFPRMLLLIIVVSVTLSLLAIIL